VQSPSRLWRRLDEDPLAGRSDLYDWFGALVASEAPAEHLSELAEAALEEAYCAYDTRGLECAAFEASREPAPPRLDPQGFNRFLLAGAGSTWLLYLDLSDFDAARGVAPPGRRVRAKLAEGVLVDAADETGSSIRITESHGDEVWAYEMMHPAVDPRIYNMSLSPGGGGGLDMAEALLQSPDFDGRKGSCRRFPSSSSSSSPQGGAPGGEAARPPEASVTFDCETGTYVWSIGGWRVLASPDGEPRAFIFSSANATAAAATPSVSDIDDDGDDEKSRLVQYRVLAHAHGSDARAHFALSRAFARGPSAVFGGCAAAAAPPPSGGGRRLQTFGNGGPLPGIRLPGTFWCGPGQDPKSDNFCLSSDFEGDWACRRHDSCAKLDWMGALPINGCSCDIDLDAARGSGPQAALIHGLFGDRGVWPCVAHLDRCRQWGWVESGRRRRAGWSYWGVVSEYDCSNWNYINKHGGQLADWGYNPAVQGNDLNSREDWPGCYPNERDLPKSEWFP